MKRGKSSKQQGIEDLATERPNPRATDLDTKSAIEIARIINSEDAKVAKTVKLAMRQIAEAIDWIANSLANGGRLIYVGTGTSGRIAALDAVECPPTFDTDPHMVQFVIAGGVKALASAVEADEDSTELGVREIRKLKPTKNDVVVGIAASGRTPFTIAALRYARRAGAKTVAVTCNPSTSLERAAHLAIVVETGPEVVAGSTRMKAGTAEKMVLNMLSTGAMVRLGYVYGNLMVNLHQKNTKLTERAVRIVEQALKIGRDEARKLIHGAGNEVPLAIVMGKAGVSSAEASKTLQSFRGHVRNTVIALGPASSRIARALHSSNR